jgi:uncharacterized protein
MATRYEWDPKKAAANFTKHGVSFETAKDVFLDTAAMEELDPNGPQEERWRIIGMVGNQVLFVVYTERNGDVIRIISARQAKKREERYYFGQATS